MRIRTFVVGLVFGALLDASPDAGVIAHVTRCEADTRPGVESRRREAIVRARNVRERQERERALRSRYATADELRLPQQENGFQIVLLTTPDGYMLFIRDTTDPCSSGIYVDQAGIIYDATPI
jgi:hypothetical protein